MAKRFLSVGLGCPGSDRARRNKLLGWNVTYIGSKHQVETLFPSGTSTRKPREDVSRKDLAAETP